MIITVRQMEATDADNVAILSEQLGYHISIADTARQIALINESKSDAAFVAIANDKVVGWMHTFYTLRVESVPFCEVGGLVVDKQYRSRGIGKLMLQKATDWCQSKGCSKLVVRSNSKRHDAHRFYLNNGFAATKQQMIFARQVSSVEK